jgi:hypothetical protein
MLAPCIRPRWRAIIRLSTWSGMHPPVGVGTQPVYQPVNRLTVNRFGPVLNYPGPVNQLVNRFTKILDRPVTGSLVTFTVKLPLNDVARSFADVNLLHCERYICECCDRWYLSFASDRASSGRSPADERYIRRRFIFRSALLKV